MAQTVSPSNEAITKGQAGKFADLLVAALVKSGLPSDSTQLVLEQYGATLATKFIKSVRDQVDGMSKIVRRTILVDRSLPPKDAISATGRKQYVTAEVLAVMPKGEGDTVVIEFIPLEKWMDDEAVDAKLAEHGLVAVDPYALAALNAVESDFATERPCFTHWKDASGKWCSAAFDDWSDGQNVYVRRGADGWGDDWWVAGVRK